MACALCPATSAPVLAWAKRAASSGPSAPCAANSHRRSCPTAGGVEPEPGRPRITRIDAAQRRAQLKPSGG
eukprot:515031-Alexandrium_andersonii.AAC.1